MNKPTTSNRYGPAMADAPDLGSPIARLRKAAKRARDEGDLAQADKFAKAARHLGCDDELMSLLRGSASTDKNR